MRKQNQCFLPSGRRNFLKTSAFLASGSLLLPKLVRSGTSASSRTELPLLSSDAPASSHVKDIGIQLYTVRTEMLADPVADPSLVTMEMDLGWVVAAGHDPFQYFPAYPGRFPLRHLKDMDKVQRRSIEFGQAGMKHFFLEQEEYAHSAFESIQLDYDYLAKLDY